MRIVFVNEKCCYFGGVEQNIADTARGLGKRGHDCFLAYAENKTLQKEYADLFAGVYVFNPRDKSGFENFPAADVFYFHKISVLPDLSAFNADKRKPAFIRMIHDHDLICPRRHRYFSLPPHWNCHFAAGWKCWLDGAFLRRNADGGLSFSGLGDFFREMAGNRELDVIIVASNFMKSALLKNGFSPEKVRVVAPAVNIFCDPASGMVGKVANDKDDVPLLLYVGQLIRGKGVDLLLRSAARLKCRFRLAIAGRGNAEIDLQKLAKKLFSDGRVKFYGWTDQETLHKLYQNARVCAVPSRWSEPYGLIGLEAMSHAKPVVAFAVGGIPDWLVHGKTGFLVPERDLQAYAGALEVLLQDEELARKMGGLGLEHLQRNFSFSVYLDKLETIFTGTGA
jgi:glycosyltransferase involved in cell wall biosynthesis